MNLAEDVWCEYALIIVENKRNTIKNDARTLVGKRTELQMITFDKSWKFYKEFFWFTRSLGKGYNLNETDVAA